MPGEPGGGFTFRAEPGRKGERLGSFLTSIGLAWLKLASSRQTRPQPRPAPPQSSPSTENRLDEDVPK